MKKLKNFIHKHENLEKLALTIWSTLWIIRAKIIFGKIKQDKPRSNFKVIILAVRAIPTTNLVYFDAIFGHAFKKVGSDVKMLYCDGVLDSCDADTIFRNQKPQCFVCRNLGCFVKNSLNLDTISYRQYVLDTDIQEIKKKVASLDTADLLNYKYLGVNVGVHARASTVRFFLSGQLNLNNPKEIAILKRKLVYAMITVKVANGVYLKEKPKVIFMLHGIYSTWGPFVDYFRAKNIDVIIYANIPFRFGHFLFSRNSREYELVAKKTWDEFSKIPLSDDEESQVDHYLSNRFKGDAGDHWLYKKNFQAISEKQLLFKSLVNKKYSRRYVLYPNLAWDACVEGRGSAIFKDIFDWIDVLINYFKKKQDYQLIIKPHPAELVWERGTKGITDYISNQYPNLPKNIIVLNPDTPLRAYELVTPHTICLTFNGTIGLELATQKTPVLVAGSCHYKDAGVVYNIKTFEEYLNLLDNPEKLISFAKANVKLAKKYAYFYFFKSLIRIPFYRDDRWSAMDWGIVQNTEKLLDDTGPIVQVCRKIINGEDIVNPL